MYIHVEYKLSNANISSSTVTTFETMTDLNYHFVIGRIAANCKLTKRINANDVVMFIYFVRSSKSIICVFSLYLHK